jgi:hypothetical protein
VQDLKGDLATSYKPYSVLILYFFLLFMIHVCIGSIRVYCRVRPFLPGQVSPPTVASIDEGNITIVTPSKSGKAGRKTFSFNKVFGPSGTQGFPHLLISVLFYIFQI